MSWWACEREQKPPPPTRVKWLRSLNEALLSPSRNDEKREKVAFQVIIFLSKCWNGCIWIREVIELEFFHILLLLKFIISKVYPLIIPALHRVLEFEKWSNFYRFLPSLYCGNSRHFRVGSVPKTCRVTFVLMSSNFLPWVRIKSQKSWRIQWFSLLSFRPATPTEDRLCNMKPCLCFVPNTSIKFSPHPSFMAICSRKTIARAKLAYLNVPMFDWAYLREDSRSKYIFQISSLGQTADNTVWSHLARAT